MTGPLWPGLILAVILSARPRGSATTDHALVLLFACAIASVALAAAVLTGRTALSCTARPAPGTLHGIIACHQGRR